MTNIRLTVWNEFRHERQPGKPQEIYPNGIHGCISDQFARRPGIDVRTATLDAPEHGLTASLLNETDVLMWWGHSAHGEVQDVIVDRVLTRVLTGMGLIVLHSGHYSKIFKRLMGTSGHLRWREMAETERLWVVNPSHPITAGLGPYIELPETEMYGEFFDIPEPESLIFISWFEGGDVFRSGAVWTRGKGKVFYFRPGHETFPIYQNPEIIQVLENAVHWAAFTGNTAIDNTSCINAAEPHEPIARTEKTEG